MSARDSTAPLQPVLRMFRVFAIALAAISPTTSVFLVYGGGLSQAGTGVAWAFVLAAVVAISMAFAYAELGSVHLGAGGAYTIVREVLGEPFGFVALLLFLVLGVLSTAAILVASATYLHQLIGALPVKWTAVAMMALVTGVSLERLGSSSWLATLMLGVELVVITAFIVACLFSTRHGLGFVTRPVVAASKGPGTTGVSFTGLLPVVALACSPTTAMSGRCTSARRPRAAAGPSPGRHGRRRLGRGHRDRRGGGGHAGDLRPRRYLTSLTSLITFTSVMIVAVYLLIASAAIVSRLRERDAERPFRMPLWPLPPVLAIVGIGLALRYQKRGDVIVTAAVVVAALLYWLAYLRRSQDAI